MVGEGVATSDAAEWGRLVRQRPLLPVVDMGFTRFTFVIKARDDVWGPVLYRLSTPTTPVQRSLKELPVSTIDGGRLHSAAD